MSLSRRFFRLTFYNILANVTAPLVGLVDLAMLGHLSEIRFLAGVALGGVIFDVLTWTFAVLRMGTTGTTAQAFGRLHTGRATFDARILGAPVMVANMVFMGWFLGRALEVARRTLPAFAPEGRKP